MTESFRTRRSKMGRNPPSFFGTMPAIKPVFPVGLRYIFYNREYSLIENFTSLIELSLLVPLQEPAGGSPRWKHPHKPGRARPGLYWYPFSIVCRIQRDIFGRSFHAVKILLEVPASRDWFLDVYVIVQSERCSETANQQEPSELSALKPSSEGAGILKATKFPGGPWDMDPETAAPWGTQGNRVGRPVPWGHRRETGTVKWGVNHSTSKGKSSLA